APPPRCDRRRPRDGAGRTAQPHGPRPSRQGGADLPGPQPARRALPGVRGQDRACVVRGLRDLLLPGLPDGGPGPRRPAPLPPDQVRGRDRDFRTHLRACTEDLTPPRWVPLKESQPPGLAPTSDRSRGMSLNADRCYQDAPEMDMLLANTVDGSGLVVAGGRIVKIPAEGPLHDLL